MLQQAFTVGRYKACNLNNIFLDITRSGYDTL
jgi:hypothetical protein